MPVPAFDHNSVLPPHLGNPAIPAHLSPYPATTVELCQTLGTTPERRVILERFLQFRAQLTAAGLVNGFQWIDGSFVEDIEATANRPPNDLDVVTVYWGYDIAFQQQVFAAFPEVANPILSKANFSVDHYVVDASFSPPFTVEWTRYWISLFSHNRVSVWKGMVRVNLNTPGDDATAANFLAAQPAP